MHTIIKLRRLPIAEGLPIPSYANNFASGIDLHAANSVEILPGEMATVDTGFEVELEPGWELQVRGRSGLAFKSGVLAHFGTIDQDYRGEIKVRLLNAGAQPFFITRGDRIAQMVLAPVFRGRLIEVETLSSTERGGNGFGSTGR